jgi:hypothetical protein
MYLLPLFVFRYFFIPIQYKMHKDRQRVIKDVQPVIWIVNLRDRVRTIAEEVDYQWSILKGGLTTKFL